MDEFANMLRQSAAQAILRLFRQEAMPEGDPLLELIALVLADENGSILPLPAYQVTDDEWLAWNRLAMDREAELVREITSLAEEENLPLPTNLRAMRAWACSIVLGTLDRMGMT